MNYQHVYHAAGFSDVVKHTVLILLINAMQKKDKPFCYIDTHAGLGLYNLMDESAQKTEEYLNGAAKLIAHASKESPAVVQQYLKLLDRYNVPMHSQRLHTYPGSPLLALSMLRTQDRAILNELHPSCAHALKKTLRGCKQVHIHQRDAYEFLPALVPPVQQRGLILIDPPFEKITEFDDIIIALKKSLERFAQGVYAVWFPVKGQPPKEFYQHLQHLPVSDITLIEFAITDPSRVSTLGLKACGLAIINPPWQIFEALEHYIPWLCQQLALDAGAYGKVQWLKHQGNK